MKRIITVSIIFILLILAGIFAMLDTNHRCHQVIDIAEETKNYVENYDMENAKKYQEKLESFWKDQEKIMRLYLRRNNLEDIEREMGSLSEIIKLEDQLESGKALDSIIQYCHEIIEDEKPILCNIL